MSAPRNDPRQARFLALILFGLGLTLGSISLVRDHPGRAAVIASVGTAALLCMLVAFPLWMRFFRLWMKMAEGMSWVMTRVILTVFFALVLTPVGLLLRLLGKGPLDLAWKDGKPSYWIDKQPIEPTVERYRQRF